MLTFAFLLRLCLRLGLEFGVSINNVHVVIMSYFIPNHNGLIRAYDILHQLSTC